jgi:carbonic anhydrase/acetyltransferase-like protein (isoleucine patch superfamily)
MLLAFQNKMPRADSSSYIVESAAVIGDVIIGAESSIWFNAVIRGDVNYIKIGKRTNIQDGCVLHVAREKYPLIIGDDVTVGHNATLHACTIESRCLIGMGATVMDGSNIGENCIIGAGSLVTPNTVIEPGNMVMGSPAKVTRKLTDNDILSIIKSASHYVNDIKSYLD